MSWNIASLQGLTGFEFENERNRIISEYIKSVPDKKRMAAMSLQLKIDSARVSLTSDEFNLWLAREMAEQLENLSDAMVHLSGIVFGAPTIKKPD